MKENIVIFVMFFKKILFSNLILDSYNSKSFLMFFIEIIIFFKWSKQQKINKLKKYNSVLKSQKDSDY